MHADLCDWMWQLQLISITEWCPHPSSQCTEVDMNAQIKMMYEKCT